MRAASARRNNAARKEQPSVNSRYVYQGYVFTDVTTPTDDGRYRARVAIISLAGTRTRSQRFIDLEVFPTPEAALERITAVAKAWIDHESDKDSLALPTNFADFQ
jgi:hypothetical protein